MPVTLPIEVYEALERGLGKEDARKIVKSLEVVISDATDYKWKTTKDELLDAIRKEFVTKEFLKAEIENQILKLDRKFTIMFLILLFAIIFLNQNALEFLAKLLGLIK